MVQDFFNGKMDEDEDETPSTWTSTMCTMYVQKSCIYLHIMCRLRFDLEYIYQIFVFGT